MAKPKSSTRAEWIGQAACRGMNVNIFYPELGASNVKYPAEAINTCANCPVVEPCLEWALHHEGHGYQGGTTPNQRHKMRSQQRIALWEPQQNIINVIVTKKMGRLSV